MSAGDAGGWHAGNGPGGDGLRCATLNCECMLTNTARTDALALWCAQLHLDAVAFSEPGRLPPSWRGGTRDDDEWQLFVPPSPPPPTNGRQHGGAALLLHRRLHLAAMATLSDESGRAVAVVIRGGSARRPSHTLIAAVYMPTALDYADLGHPDFVEAERLHAVLRGWCSTPHVNIAILLGDFNETRTSTDRRTTTINGAVGPGGRTARSDGYSLVGALCGDGAENADGTGAFIDCYRARHAAGGFTCAMRKGDRRSESRIDFCLLRDRRPNPDNSAAAVSSRHRTPARIDVRSAAVIDPSPIAAWPSAKHWPLVVAFTGDFAFGIDGDDAAAGRNAMSDRDDGEERPPLPPLPPALSLVTSEQRVRAIAAMQRLVTAGGAASLLARAMRSGSAAVDYTASCVSLDRLTADIAAAARSATASWARLGAVRAATRRNRHCRRRRRTAAALRRRLTALRLAIDDSAAGNGGMPPTAELRAAAATITALWHELRQSIVPACTARLPLLGVAPDGDISALRQWAADARGCLRRHERTAAALRTASDAATRAEARLSLAAIGRYDPLAPAELQPASWQQLRRIVSGGRSPPITAITTADGAMINDPARVADTFATHYEAIFDRPSGPRSNEDDGIISEIDARCYAGLMAAVSETDLTAALADAEWLSAPGHDGVGAGVWRSLIAGSSATHATVRAWASACIALRHSPAHGKRTVYSPIAKASADPSGRRGAARGIGDTRPIALQPALTKIVSKILARRLSTILATHRLLRGRQYAFMRGGSAHACVDALLDACERAKAERGAAYFAFVDFKGAFDAIRHDDIAPALRRLRAPPAYVAWVESSLAGLTASVRIGATLSRVFEVHRGVPQGGPESPLWYAIVLDSLLARIDAAIVADRQLHRLPRSAAPHGAVDRHAHATATALAAVAPRRLRGRPRIAKPGTAAATAPPQAASAELRSGDVRTDDGSAHTVLPLAGMAYADDVLLGTNRRTALTELLETVLRWSAAHSATVSGPKTTAAGIVTCLWQTDSAPAESCIDARGEQLTEGDAVAGARLVVGDVAVRWENSDAVTHLGIPLSLLTGGASATTISSITRTIAASTRAIDGGRLHIAAAVRSFNTFLLPKIEYRLHVAHPARGDTARWNGMAARLALSRLGIRRWPVQSEATSAIAGLVLPEHAMHIARATTAFIRLNSRDDSDDASAARAEFATVLRDRVAARSLYPLRRMEASIDSICWLGWTAVPVAELRGRMAPQGEDKKEAHSTAAYGHGAVCASRASATAVAERDGTEAAPGRYNRSEPCVAYTDGSAPSPSAGEDAGRDGFGDGACGWAVLFAGEWLSSNAPGGDDPGSFLHTLSEDQLTAYHHLLADAPLFSGRIDAPYADGSYGAELRAVLEALWRAPAGRALTICCDSKAAIDAIAAWRAADDIGRKRLRMPCRPLLREIAAAIDEREAAACARGPLAEGNDGSAAGGGDSKRGSGGGQGLPPSAAAAVTAVTFRWVKGHSDDRTIDAFANRVVDAAAKRQRMRRDTGTPSLDFAHSERWVAFFETAPLTADNAPVPQGDISDDRTAYGSGDPAPKRCTRRATAAAARGGPSVSGDRGKPVSASGGGEFKVRHDDVRRSKAAGTAEDDARDRTFDRSQLRLITGDVRTAATAAARANAVASWAQSGTQQRFAAFAAGAAEQWRYVAGDGIPRAREQPALDGGDNGNGDGQVRPLGAALPRYSTGDCALTLRLLSDTLAYHANQSPGSDFNAWRCGEENCAAAMAESKGIAQHRAGRSRRGGGGGGGDGDSKRSGKMRAVAAEVIVPYTTTHLFQCRAPAVCAARIRATRALTAIVRRYAEDAGGGTNGRGVAARDGVRAEGGGDDAYLRWWREVGIAEPSLAGAQGATGDTAAVAAAIGAFTSKRAHLAMRGGSGGGGWRVSKERRNEAVAALRSLGAHTARALWRASAASRVPANGARFHTAVAASHGEWRPTDGDGDDDDDDGNDGSSWTRRGGRRGDSGDGGGGDGDSNDLAIAEALQDAEYDGRGSDTDDSAGDHASLATTAVTGVLTALAIIAFGARAAIATLLCAALTTIAAAVLAGGWRIGSEPIATQQLLPDAAAMVGQVGCSDAANPRARLQSTANCCEYQSNTTRCCTRHFPSTTRAR